MALPVKKSLLPVKSSALPVKSSALPVRSSALPVKSSALPVKSSALPVKKSALPVKKSALPLKKSALPVKKSALAACHQPACLVPTAAVHARWESDHLWLCLLALGFNPKSHNDVRLGRDMFSKPNSRAFSVVVCFLFAKLDKHRARQTFKHGGSRKVSSPNFRKQCTLWLREISRQKGTGVPRITPSTLMCPGGARFAHIMYSFARYVMIENVKKLSVGTGIPFAKVLTRRHKDMYIAKARHRVAYNKLLQVLQKEDFVIQKYKEKAQVLIREIKRTKSEYAVMQKQFFRIKEKVQTKNDRIQKVRSMWTHIVEILTSLKKEKEVVDSVLEDCVNPCILDGTDVVLRVPRLLIHRVESNLYGFCTGNLYEKGKLNFLTVIQLLNEALMTLRDEHCPCDLKELHSIGNVLASYKNALQELETKSLIRKQQHCQPKQESVSRKREIWESKWKTILGQCPFNLIFEDDLQSASSLLSSSSSDDDERDVFHQSLPDNYDSCHEECHGKNDGALETMKDTALEPSRCDFIQRGDLSAAEATDSHFLSSFLRRSSELLSASNSGDLLIENNLDTCMGSKKPVPPKILKNGKEEFPTSAMEEKADENVTHPKSAVEKDYLEKARDELAEEIAKSVMSESTDSGEEKGMAFDDLISSLCFNPFLTRRQIPRTPENLLTEIRSSWRKAIQTDDLLDVELSSTEVVTGESSMNASISIQEEEDSTFVGSEPASPVSDIGPPVSENKSQLSSTESSFQEQVSPSHTFESSDSKTSGIQESERTESEELDCSALSGSSVEDLSQTSQNVEKSMNIPGTCLKSDSRTNTLPSDHCCSFLLDEMLCGNISVLNSVHGETTYMGILDETLPEYDSLDLSTSSDPDFLFYEMPEEDLMYGSENREDMSSSHEVLQKAASKSEVDLHQTRYGDRREHYGAELTTIPEEEEGEDYDDPVMDEGFTKMLSPDSPNESKYSLSSCMVSRQQIDGV